MLKEIPLVTMHIYIITHERINEGLPDVHYVVLFEIKHHVQLSKGYICISCPPVFIATSLIGKISEFKPEISRFTVKKNLKLFRVDRVVSNPNRKIPFDVNQ